MEDKYKVINKFIDYCFKHISDIKFTDGNNLCIDIDGKHYCLSESPFNNNELELSVEANRIIHIKDVGPEINLIKYKLSKVNEEYKTHELSLLENFLDGLDEIHKVTNINDFNYDEDRC